ncbi:hypothetical protein ACP70R_021230 [Stipagrostis hirtigluma subsp. patula]
MGSEQFKEWIDTWQGPCAPARYIKLFQRARSLVPKLGTGMAARRPRPVLDFPGRPECATVYLSPLCPELRTRVWIEYLGFPPHLWSERAANGCLVSFGGVTHFDAATFRRSGRMVAEARVTRLAEVPKRVLLRESVGGAGFLRHHIRLVVLSAEPASDEDGGGGGGVGFGRNVERGEGEGADGSEERPESVDCYVQSTWTM